MRRMLAMGLILSLGMFFQAGCGGVGVKLGPSGGGGQRVSSSSSWPDPNMDLDSVLMDFTPVIIAAVALVATAGAFSYFKAKSDRVKYALTPEGEAVRLLVHAEAPEGSDFLGDLETKELNRLEFVKNDLRNRTARLGGDIIVLDGIQQDVREGQTWGYIGIGRAYKMKIPPIR